MTPELLEYLENVEWGYETGIRYKIHERQRMLERVLPHGSIRLLRKNDQLIGTVLSLQKTISLGQDHLVNARYISVLSVLPTEGGQGHAKELVRSVGEHVGERGIQYAYIEEQNLPSAAVFKALTYQRLGEFHAITFNRLQPALSRRASPLPINQVEMMKLKLFELYHDHTFLDFHISLHPDQYWVIMEDDQIIAGVQMEEEEWSITSMPGLDGWLAVNVLPHVPILNLILNPERIPVLKIGHIYFQSGKEKALAELLEHLTHHFRKKLALVYLDKQSPIYQQLKKNIWFGLFNPLFETPVNLWARFQGFQAEEIAELMERPLHISPIDIS